MEHFYQNIGEDWVDFQNLYSKMVEHFPDHSHFVEVGSWKGRSSSYMAVEILNSNKKIKFDCVDTWEGSLEHTDVNSSFFLQELVDNKDWLYYEFLKNTLPVRDVLNPIRLSSLESAKLYPDRSLDFVFIDASHEYEDVKQDILSWYPKIKKGGYIAGHDYTTFDGVQKAVNELIIHKGLNWVLEKSYWIHRK